MVEALRIRDFRLLWCARLISLLGSWLLVVAVPAQVFTLTGSAAATGLTLAAAFVPPVLLGPFAGVWADRVDRRHLMISADLACVLAIAPLVLVRDSGDIWLVYLVLMLEGAGTVMFRPAAQAHTPAVVGTGTALSSANALNAITDGAVRLLGAPLGGALFAWAGFDLLVWLDVGSYLLSALAVFLTAPVIASTRRTSVRPVTAPARRASWWPVIASARRASAWPGGLLAELREGLAFLRVQPTARTLLLVNTVFLGANACLTALLIPFLLTILGGSARIGVVMSALGVGFLLGAPLMRYAIDRVSPGHLIGGALAVTGSGFALLFSATTLGAALPAAVVIGMGGSTVLGTVQTTLQRVTPDGLLGRVGAAMFTAEAMATLAGAVVGPAVAHLLSVTWTGCLAGAVVILSGVVGASRLPRAMPAALRAAGNPGAPPNQWRCARVSETPDTTAVIAESR